MNGKPPLREAADDSGHDHSAEDPRDQLVGHLGALRAFARSLTRDTASADDLVQETILKAWSHIGRFRAGTNLRAWLFTILRNTYYSLMRANAREVPDPEGFYAGLLVSKPEHDGRLLYAEFVQAFEKLSDEHREVLILLGASGFSCQETAQILGVRPGTVKSRASRARRHLTLLMGLKNGEGILHGVSDLQLNHPFRSQL